MNCAQCAIKPIIFDTAFRKTLADYEMMNESLIKLTGYSMETLVKLFAAGYTLAPPKYENNRLSDLEEMGE